MEKKRSVSATVDEELYQQLADRAEKEERTQGVIIRRALRTYLGAMDIVEEATSTALWDVGPTAVPTMSVET
jgi:predicted transcriptional regulator